MASAQQVHRAAKSSEGNGRAKPNLLFLSHRLPYPPHNGAAIRTLNILRLLARDFTIHGLCFERKDSATESMPVHERLDALREYGSFDVFPIPQQEHAWRFGWDHLRSVATGRAYTNYLHDSAKYIHALKRILSEQHIDLVHLDSMDLVRFLPLLDHLPVVCTHHNVESRLLRRRGGAERNPLIRQYMRLQAELLEREERAWVPRVALNITVSDEDRDILASLAPGSAIATVPNGVDIETFQPGSDHGTGCVFVGGTSWFPNRDGLEWFVAEVLPRFRALDADSSVTWVGRATPQERQRYEGQMGLHLTGYVPDIRPYVHGAACFIVPLRVGGGTRLKILDAWAMGKAVVSTPIGAEGLATEDGRNILLATEPEEFARAMAKVLGDSQLQARLGSGGRRTVEQHYSWPILGERLRQLYRPLLARAQVVSEGRAGSTSEI